MARREVNAFGLNESELLLFGALGLGLYVMMKGGWANAAQSIGAGLVNAAGGLVTGGVDAAGQGVGLPALSNITTDPYVARYIMDHPNGGYLSASKWASAAALAQALALPEYGGHLPPAGSKIAEVFPANVSNTGMMGPPDDGTDYWPEQTTGSGL